MRPGRGDGGLERLLLACLGLLLVLAGLVWAAGELAGRLSIGARPGLPPARALGLLVRLAADPTDPRAAYPAALRPHAPGAAALLATLALLTVPLLAAVVVLARRRGAPHEQAPEARWAGRRDLRPLRVRRAVPGRLVIGRSHGALVAAERAQSLLVIGATGSMKTTGLALPAILEWRGAVLATSVKGDLVRQSAGWRAGQGPVAVYDPAAASGLAAAGWSPLGAAGDWAGAQRIAGLLAAAAREGAGGLEDADFWHRAAAKLIAVLMLAAALSGEDMGAVVRWVDTGEEAAVLGALEAQPDGPALAAARACFAREERQRSSIATTAETILAPFADPAVAASTRGAEIGPELLLERAGTLYLCAPAHEQRRLRPLFVTVLSEMLSAAMSRASRQGAPLDPPLLVVLDEAANIAPLPDLDQLAATAAGHGVQLVTVFQDLAQVQARYGPRAETVVNNHRARLLLSGVADLGTLEPLSRLIGEVEVDVRSESVGPDGSRSRTRASSRRALASTAALRAIRPGEGVLVYGHLPPARVSLRPYFAERELRRRAAIVWPAGPLARPSARARPGPPPPRQVPVAVARAPEPEAVRETAAGAATLGAADTARVLGVARSTVYELWARGELEAVEVWAGGRGRRRATPVAALAERLGLSIEAVLARVSATGPLPPPRPAPAGGPWLQGAREEGTP